MKKAQYSREEQKNLGFLTVYCPEKTNIHNLWDEFPFVSNFCVDIFCLDFFSLMKACEMLSSSEALGDTPRIEAW